MTMKSSQSSKSYRRHRDDDSVDQDSPRTKKVKQDRDEEGDYDESEQLESENPSITFARCLTEEQKFHLKRKMENELADLMGDKTTDGASKVVDNMFKEFLAEKMALIEAEKRKSMATEDLSGDESESSREEGEEDDGEDDDVDAESKSDTAKDSVGSKLGKRKKHKKEKKKKKHKEKDKDKDKSKKHKRKDKDKEKDRDRDKHDKQKYRKSKSRDKVSEDTFIRELYKTYDRHRRDSRSLEKEKKSKHRDQELDKYERNDTKHDKYAKGKHNEKQTEKDSKRKTETTRSDKSEPVKSEVPLVDRGVKHRIHLDGEDDYVENQVTLSGKESTDDEKVKRKHKHKEKKKDDSPDRSKEKSSKSKEKEAKVKLEHLDDEEEAVGFTEKEDKTSDENTAADSNTSKTDVANADSGTDDKDDFKLPQRKVEEDHVSSVFERNISLKMPTIKPLEKYKELKKKDKLSASELSGQAEKKPENGQDSSCKTDDGKHKKNESDNDTGLKPNSNKESANKDGSGKKKGLPDMRLISVLPKRKVEVTEGKMTGETKGVDLDNKAEGEDQRKLIENSSSSSLVISMNSEGKIEWNDDNSSQEATPKLDDIPLPVPVVSPSSIPLPVPPVQTAAGETEESAKKPAMKIKLGSIKISETSAALIQSGLKFDTKKQALLEEGELSGSEGEEVKEDNDAKDDDGGSSSASSVGENDATDGEISSSDAETGHKKKDKKKHKHKKKKKHKDKYKEKSKRKRTHSRSRTPRKRKHSSRSRTRSPSFDKKRGVWKERSRSHEHDRDRDSRRMRRSRSRDRMWPRDRDRSRSRERFLGRYHDRGFDRPYRPRSRSPEFHRMRRDFRPPYFLERQRRRSRSKSPSEDLRLKIDKTKLREIAIANAYRNAKAGRGPDLNLKPDEIAAIKAGGKSIDELTDFCKKIQEKTERRMVDGHESDSDLEELIRGSDDEDAPFIHHPFKVTEKSEIVMNIRNARQLPVLTPADKMAQASALRLQFPVSSGSQHHAKESEWVPVEKSTAGPVVAVAPAASVSTPVPAAAPTPTPIVSTSVAPVEKVSEDQKVFPELSNVNVNIGQVVSERLSAMRKLQDNPNDSQAISEMYKSQQQMKMWAESKNLPGQFTGSTGVQVLSQAELAGTTDPKKQAWVKKDTFTSAQPVKEGIGMMLLQRMGWKAGEGLGKNKEGQKEPLMLDFKTDRRGLLAQEEHVKKKGQGPFIPVQKDLSGKHPVSALVELCNKRRWGAPHFTVINETGPDHKKNFLFKVKVNGIEYQPSVGASTKKSAKMQAAAVCLQNLGLIPRGDLGSHF